MGLGRGRKSLIMKKLIELLTLRTSLPKMRASSTESGVFSVGDVQGPLRLVA